MQLAAYPAPTATLSRFRVSRLPARNQRMPHGPISACALARAAVLAFQNSRTKIVSTLRAEVKRSGATCGSVLDAVLEADRGFVSFEPEGAEAQQAWERLATKSSEPRLLEDANMFKDIVRDGQMLLGVSAEVLSDLIGPPCGDAGQDARRSATELTELTNATELIDALDVRTVPCPSSHTASTQQRTPRCLHRICMRPSWQRTTRQSRTSAGNSSSAHAPSRPPTAALRQPAQS